MRTGATRCCLVAMMVGSLVSSAVASAQHRAPAAGIVGAAVAWPNGKTYFFRGNEYISWDIASDQVDPGYPKPIAGAWPGIWEDGFDAVLLGLGGKAYFFKGDQYIRYDITAGAADDGFPRPIVEDWPGLWPDGVDCAMALPDDKALFFRGSTFISYDLGDRRANAGSPQAATDFLANGCNAGFVWPTGKAYFFAGTLYTRFDLATDTFDRGYPKSISVGWEGLWNSPAAAAEAPLQPAPAVAAAPQSPAPNAMSPRAREETIRRLAVVAGKPIPEAPVPEKVEKLPDEMSADGNTRYVLEKHDGSKNSDSILHLGLNDDLIWPGNLVQGSQVNDFVYIPIALPRGPVTISIAAEGSSATGSSLTEEVANPTLGSMRQGIADLLKKAIGPNTKLAAKVDFSKEEVFSDSHMASTLNAGVSYGVGSLESNFDWRSQKRKTRLVAKYSQVYFTVDVNTPPNPAALFAPDVLVEDIQAAMPQGSQPLYIASVSYGMMALLFIETDASVEAIETSLKAEYDGVVKANIAGSYSSKQVLENSKIKVLVYGGSTAGLDHIYDGYEGFKRVLSAGHTYSPDSPGVPLSYKFRNAVDNSLTFVSFTSQYTLRTPLRIRQPVKISMREYVCEMADDEGPTDTVDMDRFKVWINAWNGDGSQVAKDLTIHYWDTSGEYDMDAGTHFPSTGPMTDKSVTLYFDTTKPIANARLQLGAWARDYDSTGANEDGSGTLDLNWGQFFVAGGMHDISINSADFRIAAKITIEVVE